MTEVGRLLEPSLGGGVIASQVYLTQVVHCVGMSLISRPGEPLDSLVDAGTIKVVVEVKHTHLVDAFSAPRLGRLQETLVGLRVVELLAGFLALFGLIAKRRMPVIEAVLGIIKHAASDILSELL